MYTIKSNNNFLKKLKSLKIQMVITNSISKDSKYVKNIWLSTNHMVGARFESYWRNQSNNS